MPTRLPDDLLSTVAANPGEPVPVVDDTGKRFYIVPEARLTQLEAAANDQSEAALARLRELIAEGDASPDVDGAVVHEELLARVRAIDSASA